MKNARNWERLGDIMAVMVAILLASVIVALAQTPDDPPTAQAPAPAKPVRIELKKARHARVAMPSEISTDGDADDALKKLAAEQSCLAEVVYFEARGESEAGQRAVAEVILHRLAEGSHGHTICSVVYEGVGQTFCQFTFACDGSLLKPRMAEPWRAAQVLAARMLAGEAPADPIAGATYYHAASAHPTWAPKKLRVAQIGNHIFYRDRVAQVTTAFRGSIQ